MPKEKPTKKKNLNEDQEPEAVELEEGEEAETTDAELDPDILKALNAKPKKSSKPTDIIDYIPQRELEDMQSVGDDF